MKCDVCESEATVFLTQIINGQMTTVNLCDACSKAKGVTDETGFGLAEAFMSQTPPPISAETACPDCGFTAAQLKKIGRMGCPECYNTFREGLEGLLKSMHKGTRHVGKVPHQIVTQNAIAGNLGHLREELASAVRDERYEDAARLKSEIESLQSSPPSPPELKSL
ncbi:UvrB/UvrC motif-containing protein [Prosthecobacter sp. SYSU 5D2]|uniref:UvrB/UvrC motif-containing protein n=1 Tax=Prosthecobacter sp. SYSU 5D2 TaxID=3134134 RepID=UPI0031FEF525